MNSPRDGLDHATKMALERKCIEAEQVLAQLQDRAQFADKSDHGAMGRSARIDHEQLHARDGRDLVREAFDHGRIATLADVGDTLDDRVHAGGSWSEICTPPRIRGDREIGGDLRPGRRPGPPGDYGRSADAITGVP